MPTTERAAQMMNGMVNHQAQIIAYNDDWKLMMLLALPMLLLLLLMRKPRQRTGASAEHAAVMD
jgi:DHA2 family multidrug resistance protein